MITRKEFREVLEDRHRTICALNGALNAWKVLAESDLDGMTAEGNSALVEAQKQLEDGFTSYTYIQAAVTDD
jgi:hypothetical protein